MFKKENGKWREKNKCATGSEKYLKIVNIFNFSNDYDKIMNEYYILRET